jgi:hypothetical protein
VTRDHVVELAGSQVIGDSDVVERIREDKVVALVGGTVSKDDAGVVVDDLDVR